MKALAIFLLCLSVPTAQEPKDKIKPVEPIADLTGIYAVSGNDGDTGYSGSCLIVQAGEGVVLIWSTAVHTENGMALSVVKGTGMRKGDMLCVSWGNDKGNGINVYKVTDKALRGDWLQSSALGRRNHETMTKVAPLPKTGGIQ
jgi:hypothetical protein